MAAVDGGDNPLYQQIAGDLRAAIREGVLPPGGKVPTEMDLSQRYSVSRNTARMALTALAHEGLITAGRARAGRLVRRREQLVWTHRVSLSAVGRRLAGTDDFAEQTAAQGRVPDQTIEVGIVAAPGFVAERLEVPAGESLVARRRLYLVDGAPSALAESYYALSFAQGTPLLDPRPYHRGTAALLAELGHKTVRTADEITTRMPDPAEALRLEIGHGVPVLAHVRISYAERGPVRVATTILPGDRHQLRYDLPG
ncbi:MAG: transcriptional regulator, GntR family [Actinomycetia bacterium]|nr:transcriptional regulator, GntR family [Actinomycetes bacterium]MDQ1656919.1 GntR family transcriptional regulator [Cryptosporangiaceae bacterium]